jgi:hypothetical protein
MHRHRLAAEAEYYCLPEPPAPPVAPDGFAYLPVTMLAVTGAEQIVSMLYAYACALAHAQAVVRPSLPERDLLAVWN